MWRFFWLHEYEKKEKRHKNAIDAERDERLRADESEEKPYDEKRDEKCGDKTDKEKPNVCNRKSGIVFKEVKGCGRAHSRDGEEK